MSPPFHPSGPRRGRLLAGLLVPFLLLVACGGGDDDGGGKASATTVPPTTGAAPTTLVAPTIPSGTDQARVAKATAAVFKEGDFPPPFKAEPEAMLNLDLVWQELTRCMGVKVGQPLGSATSVTYLRGIATQGRSTVEYRTEPDRRAMAEALTGPKFKQCATDVFTGDVARTAPEGGKPGPIEVLPLDFAKIGDSMSATRINASIVFPDLKIDLFQDFIVIFQGDAVLRFFFINPGDAFPQDLERQVVEKVASRAA